MKKKLEPARRVLEALLADLFPADCLLCADALPWRQRGGVCLPCWAGLPWTPALLRPGPGALDAVLWATDYAGDVRRLIQVFKFESGEALGAPLGREVALRLGRAMEPLIVTASCAPPVVVPVPLHWRRHLSRGYNQAALLALALARRLSLPLAPGLLRRARAGRSQIGLSRRGRLAALDGAFRARRGAFLVPRPARGRVALRGRTVLLVDDVMTTGATLEACAVALRASGARAVVAVVLARTP